MTQLVRQIGLLLLFLLIFRGGFSAASSDGGLIFHENKGQWPTEVLFSAESPNGMIYFTGHGLMVTICSIPEAISESKAKEQRTVDCHAYQMTLNSHRSVEVFGVSEIDTKFNFLIGDRSQWAQRVKGYRELVYSDVHPGISIRFYSEGINLKYDILVRSGANLADLGIEYDGLDDLQIENGHIKMQVSVGEMVEDIPLSYQLVDKVKKPVHCTYKLKDSTISFSVGDEYDSEFDLVIDPILIFSTFSGATADNWGSTATFDEEGNLYSGGITSHYLEGTFPTTTGAFQTVYGGEWDVAITKYDSIGSRPIYATYLGGNSSEMVQSLVVNSKNQLVIMGVTSSDNFPVSEEAYDRLYNGGRNITPLGGVLMPGGSDIYITILSEDGSDIVGSTYLGGSQNDGIMLNGDALVWNYGDESRGDVYTDEFDNIYVASKTSSFDFPIVNGFQNVFGGILDAVMVKFDPEVKELLWSSYLGGSGLDAAYSIKLNDSDQVVIAGGTNSSDLNSSFLNSYSGDVDGWVALFEQSPGLNLFNGRYLGTAEYDQAYFVDLDISNDIYLYGQTSGIYPVQGNVYNRGRGQFIHKFSADLTTSILSTSFGSTLHDGPDISPTAFLVNECGNIYLAGWGGFINGLPGYGGGSTDDLPVTTDALQPVTSGSDFYLAVLIDNAEKLLYGTFFGGTVTKTHVDGGTSRFDKLGIVYHAVCAGCQAGNGSASSDFPTTNGAWSRQNNSQNCNNAAFKFDLSSLKAKIQTNTVALDNPGVNYVCLPDEIVFENKSTGGRIFEWDFGDGKEINTTHTENIIHQYLSEGSYTVKLKIIDRTTCVEEDSTSMVVNVYQPDMSVTAPDLICEGEVLNMSVTGATAVDWYNEALNKISSGSNLSIFPDTTSLYYVDARYFQCQLLDTLQVEVVSADGLSSGFQRECIDGTQFEFIGDAGENFTTLWDFGDGTQSEEKTVKHAYENPGNYTATFTAANEHCTFTRDHFISARELNIPSVFTPENKDGKNDSFIISGTGKVALEVYNRWGRLVYQSGDYQNNWTAPEVEEGTYYFHVTIKDEDTCKGWVQIIK